MALRDDLLPDIEDLRSIAGELGFRRYEVYVRVTRYTGSRPGEGASTVTETRLLVNGHNPKVREVTSRDKVAGQVAGLSGEWEIGPLTPSFVSPDTINPPGDRGAVQVHYVLKGDGLPATGLLCQRISDDLHRPLRMMVRVRSTGKKA